MILRELSTECERQDRLHPDGYPATRDGVRLGIATAGDELAEALEEWRAARCQCPTPRCDHHDRGHVRTELMQAMAVIARVLRSLDQRQQEASSGGRGQPTAGVGSARCAAEGITR